MRSVQKALYGSMVAAILLAACFSSFNYFGDYVAFPTSNLSKCGWARVGLDANGDGLFTYRDLFTGLVAIYINAVKQFSALISGTGVGNFIEVRSASCLSVTSHVIAGSALGVVYIALSYLSLKLAKGVLNIIGRIVSRKGNSPAVRYLPSVQWTLDKAWSLQLPLALAALLIVVVTGLYGNKTEVGSDQKSQKRTDSSRSESKAKEKVKNERPPTGTSDQARQERTNPSVAPPQVAQPTEKAHQPDADRAEAKRPEVNAARAEALKSAQQRQEQIAEAERQRQAQQIQADQERIAAVRRQFEARCNLDLVNAREQAKARYQAQCEDNANKAPDTGVTRAAALFCVLAVDKKAEAYAHTVYKACMSGAPN